MKSALLIVMLVCTTTAACTARAVDIGMGDPAPQATPISLDQDAANQVTSSSDAISGTNTDTSNPDPNTAGLQVRRPASPAHKPVIMPHSATAPTNTSTPVISDDDAGHSRTPSWQSLLPGSIQ